MYYQIKPSTFFFILIYKASLIRSKKLTIESECEIFCNSTILHHIQMNRLFNDSKYFVDMAMKFPSETIQLNFDSIMTESKDKPSKSALLRFVSENFMSPDEYIEKWIPSDWQPKPSFINNIYDKNFRNWIIDLNGRWKTLGCKVVHEFDDLSTRTTLLEMPNNFIMSGERFNEPYYWDTFWIVEGLILSNMFDTVKKIIDNSLFLVNKYGFVPNGGRKYYLNRSQPPFLITMMDSYFIGTDDLEYLNSSLSTLEKEFQFWLEKRSVVRKVNGVEFTLFHFEVTSSLPRPEAYYEDYIVAQNLEEKQRMKFFSEIATAAESGWHFSSRWLTKNQKDNKSIPLSDINASSIAPVSLNSLMCYNAKLLAKFFSLVGNEDKSAKYAEMSNTLNETISRLFWNDEDGVWNDLNLQTLELNSNFYISNLVPLYFETFGLEREKGFVVGEVVKYMKRNNLFSYPGGIPTSFMNSGQQWDWPNSWPPLQHLVILGLHKAQAYSPEAEDLAFSLAEKWILNVYEVYRSSPNHVMLEKYNAVVGGKAGSGGEYATQMGFGWTNAVVMKLLSIYGHKIRTSHDTDVFSLVIIISLAITLTFVIYYYNHKCIKLKCSNIVNSQFIRLQ